MAHTHARAGVKLEERTERATAMEELNCIQVYHIYKEAWEAAVGEAFATLRLVHSGAFF